MIYSTHLLRHWRFIIGQNIRRRRVEQRLSLQKLSRLSGVPEKRIDHYELGKNEIHLDELLKIACALKIDAQQLIASE